MADTQAIISHFPEVGEVSEVKPLGSGLINDTFVVRTADAAKPDYVLQRINHAIFQNVDLLQSNIDAVTGKSAKLLKKRATPISTAMCSTSFPPTAARHTTTTERTTGA